MPRFQLRHPMGAVEIPPGEFIIGRNPDCDLVIDDPMVSRRHAALRATDARLWIEDLGSRNGIEVNEQTHAGVVELNDGDAITVGNRRFQVRAYTTGTRPAGALATLIPNRRGDRETIELDPTPTALGLRGELMDKAFAVGRVEDVEHILSQFVDTMGVVGTSVDPGLLAQVARYALRLAGEQGSAAWIDRVFTMYRTSEHVVPAPTVDEMHPVARKIHYVPSSVMRAYVEWLAARAPQLGPSDRFALQRLEGLLRVLSA